MIFLVLGITSHFRQSSGHRAIASGDARSIYLFDFPRWSPRSGSWCVTCLLLWAVLLMISDFTGFVILLWSTWFVWFIPGVCIGATFFLLVPTGYERTSPGQAMGASRWQKGGRWPCGNKELFPVSGLVEMRSTCQRHPPARVLVVA